MPRLVKITVDAVSDSFASILIKLMCVGDHVVEENLHKEL